MGIVADVDAYLQAQSLIGGATGWPVRHRVVTESAGAQLVVLTEDGGTEPEIPRPAGQLGDAARAIPQVQVRVRGKPNKGTETHAKAEEIREALHGLAAVTMGAALYDTVVAMTPEPVHLGRDDNERHEFTTSFRCFRTIGG